MTLAVLEINDCGIAVAKEAKVVEREPGFALRDASGLTLGADARAQARVAPQSVTNRFWDTLDQDTLPSEGRWRRTPADLAYAQLASLWARHGDGVDRVILVVPASFTKTQLGLILGMCRKAGIPVVNLVDSAVAALSQPPAAVQIVYFDLLLHRIGATHCVVSEVLRREASADVDQTGQVGLEAKWAAAVADECVRATRYDPMHTAAAEQTLYDALPGLLEGLQQTDSLALRLPMRDEEISVEIPRSALVKSSTPIYRDMIRLAEDLIDPAAGDAHIVLSGRFASCPDVATALADAGRWPVSVLEPDAAVLNVAADPAPFLPDGDGVGLVVQRPVEAAPVATVAETPRVLPTHILVDGRIFALSEQPFVVGTGVRSESWGYRAAGAMKGVSRRHCSIGLDGERVIVRDHSTYGTQVNGQRIDGDQSVASGDVVRIGNPGLEIRLVREGRPDG